MAKRSSNRKSILPIALVAAFIVLAGFLVLKKGIIQSPKIERTVSGIEKNPEVVKTKEVKGTLLSGLPAKFPAPSAGKVISSYQGYEKTNKNNTAFGAVWSFQGEEVNDVLEDRFMSEMIDGIELHWIIDQPEDPSRTDSQLVRGHNKTGVHFWLSVQKDGNDVTAKADFVTQK